VISQEKTVLDVFSLFILLAAVGSFLFVLQCRLHRIYPCSRTIDMTAYAECLFCRNSSHDNQFFCWTVISSSVVLWAWYAVRVLFTCTRHVPKPMSQMNVVFFFMLNRVSHFSQYFWRTALRLHWNQVLKVVRGKRRAYRKLVVTWRFKVKDSSVIVHDLSDPRSVCIKEEAQLTWNASQDQGPFWLQQEFQV